MSDEKNAERHSVHNHLKNEYIEILDGFLTALIICPDLVMPSEYLEVITGDETEDDDPRFKNIAEAERFYGLIMRHWNAINNTFRRGEIYMPVLVEDEAGVARGNDWATGFIRGTYLRHSTWKEVAKNKECGSFFVPLWALAYENDPNPSLRPFAEPLSPSARIVSNVTSVAQKRIIRKVPGCAAVLASTA